METEAPTVYVVNPSSPSPYVAPPRSACNICCSHFLNVLSFALQAVNIALLVLSLLYPLFHFVYGGSLPGNFKSWDGYYNHMVEISTGRSFTYSELANAGLTALTFSPPAFDTPSEQQWAANCASIVNTYVACQVLAIVSCSASIVMFLLRVCRMEKYGSKNYAYTEFGLQLLAAMWVAVAFAVNYRQCTWAVPIDDFFVSVTPGYWVAPFGIGASLLLSSFFNCCIGCANRSYPYTRY